jgi:7,8-dihydropterin-6-yl-methyl-4-(beta-D-ribofuranosyl)aminobenzene 5'-phosphate synthase
MYTVTMCRARSIDRTNHSCSINVIYEGTPPEVVRFGPAWPGDNFELIDKDVEVRPGVHLISQVSEVPGTKEMRELSLAIDTPEGLVLVVGCAHPGIVKVVEAATALDRNIRLAAGGLHLIVASNTEIDQVVTALRDRLNVRSIAPAHCTGEPAFAALAKAFGSRYVFAGLGATVSLSEPKNDESSRTQSPE